MFKLHSVSGSVRWSSCGWWVTVLCSCTGRMLGTQKPGLKRERSCSGEGIWGGSLCGLSADLGMTAGEENEAALWVTQDAGSIRVLTPLPYTRLREEECVVTAEFGAYSSSPLPRSVVTPSPGCLHSGLQCFVRITSHLPGGLVLWELGPCV